MHAEDAPPAEAPPGAGVAPAEVPAVGEAAARLRSVEDLLKESRERERSLRAQENALAEEEEQLRRLLIEAAEQAQQHEQSLTQLEARVAALADDEQTKAQSLAARRGKLAELLSALARVSRLPPHAALGSTDSAVDTLRAAMLLKVAIPEIRAEAEKLEAELTGLQRLRDLLADRRGETDRTARSLAEERERLQALLAHKARLQREASAERRALTERLGRLSNEAKDVRELIDRIELARRAEQARREEGERRRTGRGSAVPPVPVDSVPSQNADAQTAGLPPDAADEEAAGGRAGAAPIRRAVTLPPAVNLPLDRDGADIRRFPARSRSLIPPVAGPLTRRFGDPAGAGVESQGAEFETRDAAQVVAPFDGRVMFAGPFRGYGQILIIEHLGGYHTMLSGMERIDATVGMVLFAGEPVGVMGGGVGEAGPRLYMELRRNGRPVDPMPWLAERRGKVTG